MIAHVMPAVRCCATALSNSSATESSTEAGSTGESRLVSGMGITVGAATASRGPGVEAVDHRGDLLADHLGQARRIGAGRVERGRLRGSGGAGRLLAGAGIRCRLRLAGRHQVLE